MCAIVDHYTREVLAVFDSRYGQEIIDWLKSHPEIKVVTRDGSQSYASIITAASSLIMQISDRFHLMHNLKKDAVEPIKALLGQKRMKQPYPYPSEDEAYWYIMEDILEMGDARHRKKVRTYYDVRRLKDEGKSIAETARHLGIKSQKVYQALGTDMSKVLNSYQKQAMKVAREMARSIYNKSLADKGKTVRIKADSIWKYLVTGETESKKLLKLHETHPEVDQIIQICIRFRKMLHDEDDAPTIDDWIEEAQKCMVKEIRDYADYIKKDREAVLRACKTRFNNGLLEGTVNKAKAIKRGMYNRANADMLRAKMIYAGLKWDWNYHLN